jgi:hypothetical protein
MNPPEQLQNVFLQHNTNDCIISFKTFLNKTTSVENELSTDNFLGYVLNYSNDVKYALNTSNKTLNITGLKVLNILNSSSLSKGRNSSTENISLLMNYNTTYSKTENKLTINGTLKVMKESKLMCSIKNLVIVVEILEDKFQPKKSLKFILKYTNSAPDVNAFQKKNIAHSIRKILIPFKLAIE